ncbi:proteoglycan 4-like [Varroa destructor]|uniref:Uncharacterized protein n=1 Tax=Varroa destructor TaxID=109461 RepID=A0A7M7JR64_VARDE|nr:proteoglycan 4-like [Varroa destructor]
MGIFTSKATTTERLPPPSPRPLLPPPLQSGQPVRLLEGLVEEIKPVETTNVDEKVNATGVDFEPTPNERHYSGFGMNLADNPRETNTKTLETAEKGIDLLMDTPPSVIPIGGPSSVDKFEESLPVRSSTLNVVDKDVKLDFCTSPPTLKLEKFLESPHVNSSQASEPDQVTAGFLSPATPQSFIETPTETPLPVSPQFAKPAEVEMDASYTVSQTPTPEKNLVDVPLSVSAQIPKPPEIAMEAPSQVLLPTSKPIEVSVGTPYPVLPQPLQPIEKSTEFSPLNFHKPAEVAIEACLAALPQASETKAPSQDSYHDSKPAKAEVETPFVITGQACEAVKQPVETTPTTLIQPQELIIKTTEGPNTDSDSKPTERPLGSFEASTIGVSALKPGDKLIDVSSTEFDVKSGVTAPGSQESRAPNIATEVSTFRPEFTPSKGLPIVPISDIPRLTEKPLEFSRSDVKIEPTKELLQAPATKRIVQDAGKTCCGTDTITKATDKSIDVSLKDEILTKQPAEKAVIEGQAAEPELELELELKPSEKLIEVLFTKCVSISESTVKEAETCEESKPEEKIVRDTTPNIMTTPSAPTRTSTERSASAPIIPPKPTVESSEASHIKVKLEQVAQLMPRGAEPLPSGKDPTLEIPAAMTEPPHSEEPDKVKQKLAEIPLTRDPDLNIQPTPTAACKPVPKLTSTSEISESSEFELKPPYVRTSSVISNEDFRSKSTSKPTKPKLLLEPTESPEATGFQGGPKEATTATNPCQYVQPKHTVEPAELIRPDQDVKLKDVTEPLQKAELDVHVIATNIPVKVTQMSEMDKVPGHQLEVDAKAIEAVTPHSNLASQVRGLKGSDEDVRKKNYSQISKIRQDVTVLSKPTEKPVGLTKSDHEIKPVEVSAAVKICDEHAKPALDVLTGGLDKITEEVEIDFKASKRDL